MQISYFYLGFEKIELGFNFPPRLSTFNLRPTTFDFQLATFDLKFIL